MGRSSPRSKIATLGSFKDKCIDLQDHIHPEPEPMEATVMGKSLDSALGKHLEILGLALQQREPASPTTTSSACWLQFKDLSDANFGTLICQSTEQLARELRGRAASSDSSPKKVRRPSTAAVVLGDALSPKLGDEEAPPSPSPLSAQSSEVMDTNSAIECASMESILGSEKSDLEVLEKQRRSSRKQTSSNSSVGSLGTDGSSVMRKTTTNSRWDDIATYEAKGRLEDFVMSSRFETFFAFLIMLNMVVMIVEEQFEGSVMGFELAWYEKYGSPAYNQEYMPAAKQSFDLIELIFATVFTIEAGLRMAGRGFAYWRDKSELMDLFIVVCSNVSLLAENYASVDITLFRVLRLAKLLRIVKLIRTVEQLDSLQLMTTALYASINALCWAVVLLFIMQSFVALILTSIFRSEYLEGDSLTPEQKRQLFEYFGTYARSMLSTFELMLANWPPICRFLSESLHEGWSVVVVVYKLTFGFAFVGVINSVFMQETLNVAVTDDNIMIKTKTRATAIHRRKMEKLLKLADTNKDGFLSLAEFEAVLHNPGVKTWLESMDLETRDGKLLFHLLDKNGDDKLSVDELTQGTGRLKGIARSIDTQVIIRALLQQWFPDVRKEDGEGALVNIQSDVFAPRGAESKSCMRLSPKSGMAIGKSTDM